MGTFLRDGEFDSLFNLVGIINQIDPEQIYLKNAEFIFKERIKFNENNNLYKITIAKFFKKRSRDALITLEKLIEFDK